MLARRNSEDQDLFLEWLPADVRARVLPPNPDWALRNLWWRWYTASGAFRDAREAQDRGEIFLFDPSRHYPPWDPRRPEEPPEPTPGHEFEWGQNPDPHERSLEREARSAGDLRAAARWVREQQRRGYEVPAKDLIRLGLAHGLQKITEFDRNGDHVVHTGHKAFDRQTKAIMPGQVHAPTQQSWAVRAYDDTDNGRVEPGHLQQWDLGNIGDLDGWVHQFIVNNTRERPVLVYRFLVRMRPHPYRVLGVNVYDATRTLGWIVTSYDGQLLGRWSRGHKKAQAVIEYVTPIVSWSMLPEFQSLRPTSLRGKSSQGPSDHMGALRYNPQ